MEVTIVIINLEVKSWQLFFFFLFEMSLTFIFSSFTGYCLGSGPLISHQDYCQSLLKWNRIEVNCLRVEGTSFSLNQFRLRPYQRLTSLKSLPLPWCLSIFSRILRFCPLSLTHSLALRSHLALWPCRTCPVSFFLKFLTYILSFSRA